MLLLAVLVAACVGAVHVGTAQAISACGSFNSSATLTADCVAPLNITASGITVDLGGHKVICNSSVEGVVFIFASRSVLKNGRVTSGSGNCMDGVIVGGFSNQLLGVGVDSASAQGILVEGGGNRLTAVDSSFNGNDGVIVFGDGNVIRSSRFTGNGDDGASFFQGADNILQHNYVAFNGDKGIISGADSTIIFNNQSAFNGVGIYLSDGSTGNALSLNQTYRNNVGIQINPTSNHDVVSFNGSYANFTWDMQDDNASCDTDLWFDNLFVSANQGCIS